MKTQITPFQVRAIDMIVEMAITNSCSCDCDGTGYLGHSSDCHIHGHRKDIKAVFRFLDSVKEWRVLKPKKGSS